MKNIPNTRACILSSAKFLFNKNGYAETSIMDIATKADKAKGSIYYYFDKKETILNELYNVETSIFKNHIEDLLLIDLPFIQKFENYLCERMKHYYQNFCITNNIFNLYTQTNQEILKIQKEFHNWETHKLMLFLIKNQSYIHSKYPITRCVYILHLFIQSLELNYIKQTKNSNYELDIKHSMHMIVNGIINP